MAAYRYPMFHKPYGVLSTFTNPASRPTLSQYIAVPGVYAAGQLDFKTEDLLLLSDDGDLIHRLTDAGFDHPKTYLAQVEGTAAAAVVSELMSRVWLCEPQYSHGKGSQNPKVEKALRALAADIIPDLGLPLRTQPVHSYHPISWLRIVLKEDHKHQAR